MPEMDREKNNVNAPREALCNKLHLVEKFDGQTLIQGVVMSELLGKPKAKRRKWGRYSEGTHCR